MKRLAQAVLFTALLAAVALGLPGEAQARPHDWSLVTVDAVGEVGEHTSIAVDANGGAMISYYDATLSSLKFAICDESASPSGCYCDQPADWSNVTVDWLFLGGVGRYTSIAVDANGDPMISYYDWTNDDLKFAICDISDSVNDNCDQTIDWRTVTVDGAEEEVGEYTSIAVAGNGDPMISYHDRTNDDLKFAICDISDSLNGNCDQTDDWRTVTVDEAEEEVGEYTSIAVDANGDPMISYRDWTNDDLEFAICDISDSLNDNCDQTDDWSLVTVDAEENVWYSPSIVVDANGDPMISYGLFSGAADYLKFAICDLSDSANGNCDQPSDWSLATVDSTGNVGAYTSIAVDYRDPLISYRDDTNEDLKLAKCYLLASTNGNCDQTVDWTKETVDSTGNVGAYTSIAVDAHGNPMISYHDSGFDDLKFAIGWLVPQPDVVGGIAQLPEVSDSSAPNHIALGGLAAAALVALTAGGWYARRRWLG